MDRTPLDIRRRGFTIDRLAEDIEHARENSFPDRRLERPAGILDGHAARQTLRRRERNPADVLRIALRQNFDDNLVFRARAQDGIDRREVRVEAHIHDTAAHGNDHALVRRSDCVFHFIGSG